MAREINHSLSDTITLGADSHRSLDSVAINFAFSTWSRICVEIDTSAMEGIRPLVTRFTQVDR